MAGDIQDVAVGFTAGATVDRPADVKADVERIVARTADQCCRGRRVHIERIVVAGSGDGCS